MKKFIFLSLLLIMLGAASAKAQVAISERYQSNAKALFFPHVELDDLEILQVGGFDADEDLTEISIPGNVTSIGVAAFS
jgi:hypothetical protein